MKVICNRGALLEALGVVGQAVPARTPKPVLTCVRLQATDDALVLSATDLEIAVRFTNTQVQVEQTGEALLPADKLRDIVRESVDDTLSIELKGEQAIIKGGDSRFTVYTQAVADFPSVAEFEGEPDVIVTGSVLKGLIHRTSFAAAREGTRYAFNGVLTTVRDGRLVMVATDGRRLAQAVGDAEVKMAVEDPKKAPKSIIPTKALNLVDKLVGDPEEPVKLQIKANQVLVGTKHATLSTTLVEGQFPPFEDVIPKDNDKAMTAACGDFMSAVRRASLLTTEESKGVRMHFTGEGLKLTSRSPEAGEAEVNFACKFDGDEVEIGFNPQFLVDGLKVVQTDEVRFELSGSNRPGLLLGGDDFLYVVMPVNLQ
ncbi:MAG: DNA polymerase III subunit beta [Planctomycetota bacterium]